MLLLLLLWLLLLLLQMLLLRSYRRRRRRTEHWRRRYDPNFCHSNRQVWEVGHQEAQWWRPLRMLSHPLVRIDRARIHQSLTWSKNWLHYYNVIVKIEDYRTRMNGTLFREWTIFYVRNTVFNHLSYNYRQRRTQIYILFIECKDIDLNKGSLK